MPFPLSLISYDGKAKSNSNKLKVKLFIYNLFPFLKVNLKSEHIQLHLDKNKESQTTSNHPPPLESRILRTK